LVNLALSLSSSVGSGRGSWGANWWRGVWPLVDLRAVLFVRAICRNKVQLKVRII
jgi:hypothetical protein